jgi:hypothetical protein
MAFPAGLMAVPVPAAIPPTPRAFDNLFFDPAIHTRPGFRTA